MSTSSTDLNRDMLNDSERHTCGKLEDHWVKIVVKDNEGIIWDNSTIGGPEFEAPKNGPIVAGIAYCPFCGERLGEPDETTEAVTEVLADALACVDNIGYRNYSKADFDRSMRVKDQLSDERIQITVLDPHIKLARQ